jgi:hypothetical protein
MPWPMVMCLSVRFAGGGGSEEAPCCLQLVDYVLRQECGTNLQSEGECWI